ncbi:MAG: GIY-YIG nuclease family protein [Thermoproteota archaeon]|nr:GIY-YIG nuclease family protein [Thermoproteota archaeon]
MKNGYLNNFNNILKLKGSYILIIKIKKKFKTKIGKIGDIDFKKGYYLYIGSSKKTYKSRILRYLSKIKRKHWHIDYLITNKNAIIIGFILLLNKNECDISKIFYNNKFKYVSKFGCSDCKCRSHLFYIGRNLKSLVTNIHTLS